MSDFDFINVKSHSDDYMKDCTTVGVIQLSAFGANRIEQADHCAVCRAFRSLAMMSDNDRALVFDAFDPIDNTGHEESKDV